MTAMMYQGSVSLLQTLRHSVTRGFVKLLNTSTRRFKINMVQTITVEGYEALNNALKEHTGNVYVLFSGSPNSEGVSWCPDCIKAEPVIAQNFEKAPSDAVLIHCNVGDRTYWKDPKNDFRKDPQFAIRCVPTLIKIGTHHKLEEEQCCKSELIQMLLEDD